MEKLHILALLKEESIELISIPSEIEIEVIRVSSIDELISKAFELTSFINLIHIDLVDKNYKSIIEEVLDDIGLHSIIIGVNGFKSSQSNSISYFELTQLTEIALLIKQYYFESNSKRIREKVLNNISPIFSELSQCLLQINQDISYSIKQNNLKELDRLYLEIRPILDAFHFIDNSYEHLPKLSFPLLEKLRFFIVRYQTLSQGKLLFSLESVIRYNDLVIGSYHGISTLLELVFCFCIIHTEYGLIHIQITNEDANTIRILFDDTGSEQSKSHTYARELEQSYEMLATLISKQLGYSAKIIKNELEGFNIEIEFQLFSDQIQQVQSTSKTVFNFDKTKVDKDNFGELEVHYRELIHELAALLNQKYDEKYASDWRNFLHKVWPSVEMMGDKDLAVSLKKLHFELKANPISSNIKFYQEQVKSVLNQFKNNVIE